METYLWGFRNKATCYFKATYKTIQGKTKTACFRNKKNAETALALQPDKSLYTVSEIAIREE